MTYIRVLLVIFVFSGIVFAQEPAKEKKVFTAVVDKDGIQRVKITGNDFYFDPNYITLKVNVPAELTVKKASGITPHDIVIEAPDAGINVKESLSATPQVIKFTPRKAGEYLFYCSKKLLFFKSHRDRGMEGIIKVAE